MKKIEENQRKLNLDLYRKLYLIRRSEKAIQVNYSEDEMKTPMHMSMGEEAIVTGVCHALGTKGQALGSYRSHAVYLAMTEETDKFFAEMYGKATGTAKGKAGSMHLSFLKKRYIGASAIVASTIPVAAGVAFGNMVKRNRRATAVFFGDGAVDEGSFWEALNLACLMRLPVLFVCEDNGFAVHNPPEARHGYDSIVAIVKQIHCQTHATETTDVEEVYNLTKKALKDLAKNKMPIFLHAKYYRYLEHVGIYEDFEAGYRDRTEFDKWFKKDPINLQRKKLIHQLGVSEKTVAALENKIGKKITRSIEFAKKSPSPEAKEVYTDVLA